jgi:ketosteroid isomerase-like protein
MSEENFEVVERLYALFASRDVAAAIPDYAAPNLELRVPPLYPDTPEVFRGREGIERWMRMIDEAWAEWRLEPERYLDAGSTVVVLARLTAEGGSSGIHLEREVAHVWTLEQGRAVSIRVYLDQAEALEAVGLSEAPSE